MMATAKQRLGLTVFVGRGPAAWHGPVLRFRRLTPEQRAELGLAPVETRRSESLTWICPACRTWTLEGSAAIGACVTCGTPRLASAT